MTRKGKKKKRPNQIFDVHSFNDVKDPECGSANWQHLLELDTSRYNERLNLSISEKSGIDDLPVWAFVYGTVRHCARPSLCQRCFYNGHKQKEACAEVSG
jgi:hypothetical protein